MRGIRVARLVATLLLVAVAASGQQRPQFRADVSRVRVDVIVTDEGGRFIDDLEAEDFLLTEDGVRQEILSVQLVDLAGGRIVDLVGRRPTSPEVGGETPIDETDPPPGAPGDTEIKAGAVGQVIMLIDLVGFDWRTKARFPVYLQHWLEDIETLRLPWALYLIDHQSQLYELAPLGRDIDQLLDALDWFRDLRWLPPARGVPRMLNDDVVLAEALAEYAHVGSAVAGPRLAAHLTAGVGRTALVWVTRRPTRSFLGRDVFRAANSANVSIYVLDASMPIRRGGVIADVESAMTSRILAGAEDGMLSKIMELENLASFERRSLEQDWASELREVAESTGGSLFRRWVDLDPIIDTIASETSRYYLLTYAPPPPEADGRYHEIDLSVRRPGANVRARRGYIDFGPAERRNRLADVFRTLSGDGGRLSVESEAFLTWTPAGEPAVILATSVDPSELGVGASSGEPPTVAAGLRATAYDEEGDAVADMVGLIQGPDSPAEAGALEGRRLGHLARWLPEPECRGLLAIELTVVDQASSRSGRARLAVEIPEIAAGGWHASTPMLVSADSSAALVPLVAGRAPPGQPVGVFLQVVGGESPDVSGRLLVGAEPGALGSGADTAQLTLAAVRLVAVGNIHQGLLQLPALLVPGDYTIEVTVRDVPADQRRTTHIPLKVIWSGPAPAASTPRTG